MYKYEFELDDVAYISKALVSRHYCYDTVKETVRDLHTRHKNNIVAITEEVKSSPRLKAIYKDWLLMQLYKEHTKIISD